MTISASCHNTSLGFLYLCLRTRSRVDTLKRALVTGCSDYRILTHQRACALLFSISTRKSLKMNMILRLHTCYAGSAKRRVPEKSTTCVSYGCCNLHFARGNLLRTSAHVEHARARVKHARARARRYKKGMCTNMCKTIAYDTASARGSVW